MNKRDIVAVACVLAFWSHAADAARRFTNTQAPVAGTAFDMGSTQSLTYLITNTATAPDNAERIYEVRFGLSSGSLFSASTAAPAGWTRSAFSTTAVTFQASSWANAIAVGAGGVNFTLVINMRTAAADANTERLREIRAEFTNTTTGPPFTSTGRVTTNNPGLWTLKSLAITSFQITDIGGAPVSAITSGSSFQVRMTVRNNSSVAQNPVVSNTNPPTSTETGTVTQVLTSTTGSPLNLAVGTSGTIIFTFSTVTSDNGTIFFTANAQNGTTVTSSNATTGTLSVSSFAASISVVPVCQYSDANITVTMTVSNGSLTFPVTGVTPTLTPVAGVPVTAVSGPTPASIASIGTLSIGTFTWVYQVNSVGATNPFTFSGSASGTRNAGLITSLTSTSSPATTRGTFTATVSPTTTNASSDTVELTFGVVNNDGCANVNSVAVTTPAGWTWSADAYSLVNLSGVTSIETWTVGGANPVVFTAPNVAGQLPLTFSGAFSMVFSATPAAAGASVFTIRVTDNFGAFVDLPVTVTVNAFKSGTLNNAVNKTWREDFR